MITNLEAHKLWYYSITSCRDWGKQWETFIRLCIYNT